ncbi:hypothetical protein CFP65_6749 [Kitasatospora sp. MMS16-BH015]|uniref:DUF4232 domain-containing protein n=1 Tax=Kitasatospora sp. MMS16-BH015 TaxID=2018025 RepID=UPI000CA2E165|nr:DUF4232 domain-containing protein [Kitasatospora sp. MMS16-BH015]AUG81389.1 hypothetical protein CFP65_6749 [Kitasatospora sp. MMS16-BH015]
MRVRPLAFAALAATAALSLTACQDDAKSAPQGAPAASTGATAFGGPAASGQASNNQPGSQSSNQSGNQTSKAPASSATGKPGTGKAAQCRTADLTITAADRTITGDATRTVVVELKNHSGKDCALTGYAGVDLKTSAGTLSAQRDGQPAVAAVVPSGKSTYFGISYPANTSGGSGVRITGLVVTPPDETHPVTLPWPGAGSLPVTEGGGSAVKIGPLGSAGQGGE